MKGNLKEDKQLGKNYFVCTFPMHPYNYSCPLWQTTMRKIWKYTSQVEWLYYFNTKYENNTQKALQGVRADVETSDVIINYACQLITALLLSSISTFLLSSSSQQTRTLWNENFNKLPCFKTLRINSKQLNLNQFFPYLPHPWERFVSGRSLTDTILSFNHSKFEQYSVGNKVKNNNNSDFEHK